MLFSLSSAGATIANLFVSRKQITFEYSIKEKRILGDMKRMEG